MTIREQMIGKINKHMRHNWRNRPKFLCVVSVRAGPHKSVSLHCQAALNTKFRKILKGIAAVGKKKVQTEIKPRAQHYFEIFEFLKLHNDQLICCLYGRDSAC